MALNNNEIQTAVTIQRVLAAVTLLTCSFIVLAIILFQKYRFPSSRLVLWLSIAAGLQTLCYLVPYEKGGNSSMCDFQAFWISFFDWCIALWICVIAFNLHQIVVLGNKNAAFYERYYHIVVWGCAFTAAVLPLLGGNTVYGDSGAWCWIVKEKQAWRVGVWYGPLLIFFLYVLTMYLWIVKTLYSQKHSEFYQREGEDEARTKWKASMRLTRYPLIFIIMWIFPILNRIENWMAGDDGVFFLVLMHTICVSMQGTINSIAYCIDEENFTSMYTRWLKIFLLVFHFKGTTKKSTSTEISSCQ